MRRLLVLGAVAGSLTLVAPAQAHPSYHYEGGCGFTTLSDGSEHDQTPWQGEATATVVATDSAGMPSPTTFIKVECHLYRNGVWIGEMLTASGRGVAAAADVLFAYHAHPADVMTVCEEVTVGGELHVLCGDATTH